MPYHSSQSQTHVDATTHHVNNTHLSFTNLSRAQVDEQDENDNQSYSDFTVAAESDCEGSVTSTDGEGNRFRKNKPKPTTNTNAATRKALGALDSLGKRTTTTTIIRPKPNVLASKNVPSIPGGERINLVATGNGQPSPGSATGAQEGAVH